MPNPPAPPTDLQATDVRDTEIDITWTDPDGEPETDPEDGYRVYISTDGGSSWTEVADRPADTESHTITGLSHGEQYVIQVEAYNAYGRVGTATTLVAGGEMASEASPTDTIWRTEIAGTYITE